MGVKFCEYTILISNSYKAVIYMVYDASIESTELVPHEN